MEKAGCSTISREVLQTAFQYRERSDPGGPNIPYSFNIIVNAVVRDM